MHYISLYFYTMKINNMRASNSPIRNPEFHCVSRRYSRIQTFFFLRSNCHLVTSQSFQEEGDSPNCRFPCVKGTKERQVASLDSCFTEKRGAVRGENFCPAIPMRCLMLPACCWLFWCYILLISRVASIVSSMGV